MFSPCIRKYRGSRTCIHASIQYLLVCLPTDIHTYIHICIYTYIYTYIHISYMCTYIHHICIYTHIMGDLCVFVPVPLVYTYQAMHIVARVCVCGYRRPSKCVCRRPSKFVYVESSLHLHNIHTHTHTHTHTHLHTGRFPTKIHALTTYTQHTHTGWWTWLVSA